MKRLRQGLIALAIYLVAAGCLMFAGCTDKLLLFPTTRPIDAHGARRHLLPFDGGHLEIWSARSPASPDQEPQAYVLAFVGNAARAEYVALEAEEWRNQPVEVWCLNHPGFGGSTGPAKLSRLAPAAIAAYDAIARQANGRPIFIKGTSLGTTMALYVAAHRPVGGLVLRTPPPLRQIILGDYGWWNLWLLAGPIAMAIPADLDSLHNATKTKAPAIFLIADQDEVVPSRYQQMLANAYPGTKTILTLNGSNHNSPLTEDSRRQLDLKLQWLWQQAAPRPATEQPHRKQ